MTSSSQAVVDVTDNKVAQDKPKANTVATWCSAQWKAILAELVSTTLLVLFGCMSCIPIDGLTEQSPLYAPFGFGFAVMFNIQIFGHLSGAHMNPAVTLASVIWGGTSIAVGVAFFVVQCLGAFIGYGILIGLSPVDLSIEGICVTLPHHALTQFQSFGVEVILTATLTFVCCALWDPVNQHKQDSVPLKFGLTVAGLSIAGGPLTGASMNPARTLAPALWTGMWAFHWVYWAGPFVGATIAALFYKLVLLDRSHN